MWRGILDEDISWPAVRRLEMRNPLTKRFSSQFQIA